MPTPTLVTTPGALNANSYCSLAEADAYHSERLHSDAWPANISASATIGSGANGVVTITVAEAGTTGNGWTVAAALNPSPATNAPLVVTVVGMAISILLATDGAGAAHATANSAALVKAAIDSVSLGAITTAYSGTGATQIPVTALKSFTGGSFREEIKNPALIWATRLLDSMYEWAPWATTVEQPLGWPRTGIESSNHLENIEDMEIPIELKWATAEFARQLIGNDLTANSDVETQGITSLTAGPVSLSFKDGVVPKVVPDAVANFIPSWWGRNTSKKQNVMVLTRA